MTTDDALAPLTEEQLAAMEYEIGRYSRMFGDYLHVSATMVLSVIAEVRTQRRRLAAQERVVEAARLVDTYLRWVHVGTDKWSGREVPNDDDLEQLSAALKALEAPSAVSAT